ncbi:MAG: NAD(P)-dependent oxidoreductase [Opitutaceae bacterium]|nr:NAD(P)-dependent oxidoreductase [Opitutaceae bacterium]
MKIAVTGAAGRLGRETVRLLVHAGHEVTGVDVVGAPAQGGGHFHVADLCDASSTLQALGESETVVHLGNHTTSYGRPAGKVFNENVAMNFNVLEAARAAGARRIIFASSVQVIRRERLACEDTPSGLSRLPLDGEMPAVPSNPYSLSKAVGESQLRYAAANFGMTAVALRFPALLPDLSTLARAEPYPEALVDEAFTWLSYADAARCIQACLMSPIIGYRCYFPAHPRPWVRQPVEALRQRYFPEVPVTVALPLVSFVDGQRLRQETGWAPQDGQA